MKITVCVQEFIELEISNPLILKAYEVEEQGDSLTDNEYYELKKTISNLCGIPHEEDDNSLKYWLYAYSEDGTPIYE